MTNFDKCIMFSMVVFVLMVLANKNVAANRMYHHPGETLPNTVEAAIGTDFNITCYMNPKAFPGKNSSSLYFVNGRTNVEFPRDNIVIANSTTIIYMVHNASEQQTEYRCKCKHDAIMETKVFVGSPPRQINDFTCHSYDFDYMICNFTKPPNPILTTYNVSYNVSPNYFNQPNCNYDDRNYVVCNTSLKTRYEFYTFIIESRNALVKLDEKPLEQRFNINNFDIVIPSKPGDNIRVENLAVDSIRLIWQMNNWEKYRARGLEWEVLVQPENSTTLRGDDPTRENNGLRLRLNNLPYAYWRYELKLRVRVRIATAIWSEQLIFPFRTAARRPQRPPLVQPGSFYIDSMETHITIYWKELLPFEYNGDNFTYVVTVRRNGKLLDLKPFHQEINLAKFELQKDLQYEFEIRSRNHMGESIDASHLTIYPLSLRNPKAFTPQTIHNVYHANNRTYTLTWSKPKNITELSSFTVYWCYPKRALPNECRESMFFQQLSAEQLNFTTNTQNILEEHTLNLAVSANYDNFNTGLHWTDCTMDVDSDLVKMDPDIVAATNSINVHWSVERVCPSILGGFNITYCEVSNDVPAENSTCLNKLIFKLAKKDDKKFRILELKPYTMYKISMFMFSRSKVGKPSDSQFIRTLEGAPSPPRQLLVDDITNTSATIRWLEPSQPNGKIRKYIIMLNNEKTEVNATTLTYRFENLDSFSAYKVYVLAETVEISGTSNDVHFTTSIGYPSPPGLAPSSNNPSCIQWSKPFKPRGRIEFYEVAVTQMRNEVILRQRISSIIGDTACNFVKAPTCIGAEYKTTVEVRAVNAALLTHETTPQSLTKTTPDNGYYYLHDYTDYEDNEDLVCEGGRQTPENLEELNSYMNNTAYRLYKSPWQTSAIYSCSTSRMSKITTIALVVVGMSLGVMAALYMARKKYNKMANINCTLPAGLETYFTKEANSGFPGNFGDNVNMKDTRTIEDQWISAARMHEFNFRNEHHHLLSSLGNDSGYIGGDGGGRNTGCVGISGRVLSSSLETANISDDSEQPDKDDEEYEKSKRKDHFNTPTSSADSLVESTEGSEECHDADLEQHSPLTVFPNINNSGYIKSSSLQPWQHFNDHIDEDSPELKPAMPPTSSGYITVQNLNPLLTKTPANVAPPTSGYVLQQDLHSFFHNTPSATTNAANQMQQAQNIPTFSSGGGTGTGNGGYTTLDDLSKLNISSSMATPHNLLLENSHTNPLPDNDTITSGVATKAGGISGYVTQHDLNIFAQHQQQQQ